MEYRKGKEKEGPVRIGKPEKEEDRNRKRESERDGETLYGAGEPRGLLERNAVVRGRGEGR